jgi:hypothetical protein
LGLEKKNISDNVKKYQPFEHHLLGLAAERQLQPVLDDPVLALSLTEERHAVVPARLHDGLE